LEGISDPHGKHIPGAFWSVTGGIFIFPIRAAMAKQVTRGDGRRDFFEKPVFFS